MSDTPAKPPRKPRQTRTYPTLESWIQNEIHQERIKAIATDEVFLAACHFIAKKFEVSTDAIRVESAELLARKTAMHSVASQIPDLFVGLIQKPAATAPLEPWEHIHPKYD